MQYADDTSLILKTTQTLVTDTFLFLVTFSQGLGLVINWKKFVAYWWDGGRERPDWTLNLPVKWANVTEVVKLLEAPFGLCLDSTQVY